jgi:hypothetical protein
VRSHDVNRALVSSLVAEVFAAARHRGATGRETRRLLRAKFATLSPLTVSRAAWYRAAVKAAGCLLLDIPDARQPRLIEIGPRVRRPRRKKTHAA